MIFIVVKFNNFNLIYIFEGCKLSSSKLLIDYSPGYSGDQSKHCHLFYSADGTFDDRDSKNCDGTRNSGNPVYFACKKNKACCKINILTGS
jgi:hypothetical protein